MTETAPIIKTAPITKTAPAETAPAVKPLYRVPSMAEIAALPGCGLRVASTFSGCGGSCLGWRMAGFEVVWASEFIPAARDSYRANAPNTPLDPRDIRTVSAGDLLAATGLKPGELDVLEGSPPCAAFSTAGSRHAGWGQVRDYSDTRQRVDDLFFEYVRLVQGVQPRVFVAENVSGLVKGVAKGYFLEILAALRGCGYEVEARLLDAQWLGIPQSRQRLIFIGVRNDLGLPPVFPRPLPYRYSVREALELGVARVLHDTGGLHTQGDITDRPCPAITVGTGGRNAGHFRVQEVQNDGEVQAPDGDGPSMERFDIGAEWKRLPPGGRSERFQSLCRPHADLPCPTVTAAGGSGGTASVTHPWDCRKFTIAELRRLCGFPDDFQLTGNYARQWERLGRAVPPVMMAHVAAAVRDGVLLRSTR